MPRLDLTREALDVDLQLGELPLTDDERSLAIDTWRGRMLNEHVSARVFAANRSEPESGSDRPMQKHSSPVAIGRRPFVTASAWSNRTRCPNRVGAC